MLGRWHGQKGLPSWGQTSESPRTLTISPDPHSDSDSDSDLLRKCRKATERCGRRPSLAKSRQKSLRRMSRCVKICGVGVWGSGQCFGLGIGLQGSITLTNGVQCYIMLSGVSTK